MSFLVLQCPTIRLDIVTFTRFLLKKYLSTQEAMYRNVLFVSKNVHTTSFIRKWCDDFFRDHICMLDHFSFLYHENRQQQLGLFINLLEQWEYFTRGTFSWLLHVNGEVRKQLSLMQNVKRVMWLKLIMDTPWGRQTPSFTICGSVLAVSYKIVFLSK